MGQVTAPRRRCAQKGLEVLRIESIPPNLDGALARSGSESILQRGPRSVLCVSGAACVCILTETEPSTRWYRELELWIQFPARFIRARQRGNLWRRRSEPEKPDVQMCQHCILSRRSQARPAVKAVNHSGLVTQPMYFDRVRDGTTSDSIENKATQVYRRSDWARHWKDM